MNQYPIGSLRLSEICNGWEDRLSSRARAIIRMVTGDNIRTANAMVRKSSILSDNSADKGMPDTDALNGEISRTEIARGAFINS